MDTRCPRCGEATEIAGHEDGRAFYVCGHCRRVWPSLIVPARSALTAGRPMARVLVADDSEAMVQLLGMWLEEEHCEVLRALSGRQALDLAATLQPDIAFLDIVMPPPDGFKVCEALKQHARTEVILMTGVASRDTPRRASDLDVITLLRKPFTHDEALAAYTAALARAARPFDSHP